jgi:hypothetical protein
MSDPFFFADFQVRAASVFDADLLAAFCRANPGYDVFLTGEVPDETQ